MCTNLLKAQAPGLKIGSHNTCSLVKHGLQAARQWRMSGYKVVLVQETRSHTSTATATIAFDKLQDTLTTEGWTVFWSHNSSGNAGVAIAIDTRIIETGELVICGTQVEATASPGRGLRLTVRWAGHEVDLICAYVPSSTSKSTAQVEFLEFHLSPLFRPNRPSIIGGDFNYVHDTRKDRWAARSLVEAGTSRPSADKAASTWDRLFPQMVDTYRHLRPSRRDLSFYHTSRTSASRIDRLYASNTLMNFITSASVSRHPGPSDHFPVSLILLGKTGVATGRGRPRVQTGFFHVPELDASYANFVREEAAQAPADSHALLAWFPSFVQKLCSLGQKMHAASRARSENAIAAATIDLDNLRRQLTEDNSAATYAALLASRKGWQANYLTSCKNDALRARRTDIHTRERLSAGLAASLRSHLKPIPALRNATGRLTTGISAAETAAHHYATISTAPPTCPAAQEEVLAALQGAPTLLADDSELLGCQLISSAEVFAALKHSRSGKSPGFDGVPVEIYRRYADSCAPLLAKVFTAINTTGQTPLGFLDGLICLLPKGGDPTATANYRPITLLHTAYRVLAKVMANRLHPLLHKFIDVEQTAFVKGRSIADSIMTMQCLPRLLQAEGKRGFAAFCDFSKAFDTVDREFLFQIMDTLGLGEGFISTVRILLPSITYSRARVNNFISKPAPFAAGVRQGCPLAPLLYLCIAQALLRLLKSKELGVTAAGRKFTASQYADDAHAFLASIADVTIFRSAMDTFAKATGQVLNVAKTKLLPIGYFPFAGSLPLEIAGMPVVTTATALGVEFSAYTGDPVRRWSEQLAKVHTCFTAISRKPLSSFGRAFASGSFGISKVLHHAEFCGAPDPASTAHLERLTAKLVDRGLAPDSQVRGGARLPSTLLKVPAPLGGLGSFPWEEHISARHALLGLKVLKGNADTPWVFAARALMRSKRIPLFAPVWQRPYLHVNAPLGHLGHCLASLSRLPAPQVVGPKPVVGPWCLRAPLWGSVPYFTAAGLDLETITALTGLSHTSVCTVGEAITSVLALLKIPDTHIDHLALVLKILQPAPSFPFPASLCLPSLASRSLTSLCEALPDDWRWAAVGAAVSYVGDPGLEDVALEHMLAPVGWRRGRGPPTMLSKLRVKEATRMLLQPAVEVAAQRLGKYAGLAATALEEPDTATQQAAELQRSAEVVCMLGRLWRMPWDNKRKEPMWRLVSDGVPTTAKFSSHNPKPGAPEPKVCGCCGAARPGRVHHFWECLAAQSVRTTISGVIGRGITQEELWLARPPGGVSQQAWDVVCVAAVAAMDCGRSMAFSLAYPRRGSPVLPASRLSTIPQQTFTLFWEYLADFTAISGAHPPVWATLLGPEHPFFFRFSSTSETPILELVAPLYL